MVQSVNTLFWEPRGRSYLLCLDLGQCQGGLSRRFHLKYVAKLRWSGGKLGSRLRPSLIPEETLVKHDLNVIVDGTDKIALRLVYLFFRWFSPTSHLSQFLSRKGLSTSRIN